MRFARYRQDGGFRIGIVAQDGAAIREMAPAMTNMLDLIDRYDALRSEIRPVGDRIPLEKAELDAPIAFQRRSIFCVGKNYREHAREFSQSGYEAGAAKGSGIDDYPRRRHQAGEHSCRPAHAGQPFCQELSVNLTRNSARRSSKI